MIKTTLQDEQHYDWRNGANFTKFVFIHIQCCYCYSRIYLFTFNHRVYLQEIYLFTFNGVFLSHDYIYSHLRDVFIHIQRVTFVHEIILVPRGRATFGQHQESRHLARSNDIPVLNGFVNTIDWDQSQSDLSDLILSMRRVTGSPWIADLPLLDLARGRDFWCWPKGARPLATRMDRNIHSAFSAHHLLRIIRS